MFEDIFQSPGTGTLMTHSVEIIIMWLVSGLLGLLIGYVLWYKHRQRNIELQKTVNPLKAKIAELQAALEKLQTMNTKLQHENKGLEEDVHKWKKLYEDLLAKMNTMNRLQEDHNKKLSSFFLMADDLTRIEGIDTKIEALLQDSNIYTFQDIANTNLKTLQEILKRAGRDYRKKFPEAWRKQAYQLYQSRKKLYNHSGGLKIGRKQLEWLRNDAE